MNEPRVSDERLDAAIITCRRVLPIWIRETGDKSQMGSVLAICLDLRDARHQLAERDQRIAQVEREWCASLLPEGPEVIQHVTERRIKLRDGTLLMPFMGAALSSPPDASGGEKCEHDWAASTAGGVACLKCGAKP